MKTKLAFFIVGFFIFTNGLFADDHRIRMFPGDRLIFDVFFDIWQNTPDEIDLQFFNRGVNIALFYDYPLGYSRFSVAPGISFTSHNLYSNHKYEYSREIDGFSFVEIDNELQYSNNKISLNYIDIPVEFRFRTTPSRDLPRPFRIALGVKFGYLLQAHTKYAGEEYINNNNATRIVKVKEHNLNNIELWRYGVMARIGYGYVNITAYYPLSGIFKKNAFNEMTPISVGLSFVIN